MKFLVVAGARPNFMKVAPIMDAFAVRNGTVPRFEVRSTTPANITTARCRMASSKTWGFDSRTFILARVPVSHAEQTARVMVAFEEVCLTERPDWAIVVGDVNSTLACSITAKKLGIRVAHVEAGLRSRDMTMPEEINRLCTDAISDLLFTTDEMADENLRAEGIAEGKIVFVGNTMIDHFATPSRSSEAIAASRRDGRARLCGLDTSSPVQCGFASYAWATVRSNSEDRGR